MGKLKVTIDGVTVDGRAEMTILEAAAAAGIEIPTLCHQEGISPSGNCRICVVEVEGSKRLVGSCHTPIQDGMVIHTRSPKVLKARQATVELLLSGHTGTCVTDVDARECRLHGMASDLEVGPPRFFMRKPRFYPAEEGNPYVRRDMSKCILCRKCIRACSEIAGQNIYAMAYRGFQSKVIVDLDVPLEKDVCMDCGVCVDYCPTSALSWAKPGKKPSGSRQEGVRRLPEEDENRSKILPMLEEEQQKAGYISEESMKHMADKLGLSTGDVYGVATFYSFLSVKPKGRHMIRICKSATCHIKDAPMIIESVQTTIGIGPEETTEDGTFSFELVNCIGACDQAPAMLVDDEVHGNLTPEKIAGILKSYH